MSESLEEVNSKSQGLVSKTEFGADWLEEVLCFFWESLGVRDGGSGEESQGAEVVAWVEEEGSGVFVAADGFRSEGAGCFRGRNRAIAIHFIIKIIKISDIILH